MKKLFLTFSILVMSFAHAGSYSEYYSHCVLKKQGKFNYTVGQVDSFNRSLYTPVGSYHDISHHTIAGIIRGSTRMYDEARNAVSVLGKGEFVKGKNIQSWTKDSLKEQARRYYLNSFEKASLVNCAVMSLINYRDNLSTKLGSIIEIYEKGEGICTEMTDIAIDLGESLGLKVRSVVSDEDHNWPEYKIGGRWYILDPTSSSYNFMEALRR